MTHSSDDDLGFCRLCARAVDATAFDAPDEHREFMITAICASCQRLMFAGAHHDPPVSCPVLYGNVLGVVADVTTPREAGVVPFRYDPWHRRFEWQPQHVLRAGAALAPVDPAAELGAMRGAWGEDELRVLTLASCDNPVLSARVFRAQLLIVLHRLDAVLSTRLFRPTRLPPSVSPIPLPFLVDLSRDVPWAECFGASLLPLDAFLRAQGLAEAVGSAAACEASALRKCALVARLLELPARADPEATVFDQWLLALARPAGPSNGDSDDVL